MPDSSPQISNDCSAHYSPPPAPYGGWIVPKGAFNPGAKHTFDCIEVSIYAPGATSDEFNAIPGQPTRRARAGSGLV